MTVLERYQRAGQALLYFARLIKSKDHKSPFHYEHEEYSFLGWPTKQDLFYYSFWDESSLEFPFLNKIQANFNTEKTSHKDGFLHILKMLTDAYHREMEKNADIEHL